MHINVYFKDHLSYIYLYKRGFLCLIHLKSEKQTSFPLSVNNAHLYAFYLLNGIELVIHHYELFIFLNFCVYLSFLQTKTGIALLYDEVSENAYDIRLKLTKEVLTIQKQDVVCVSGSDHSANVSASISLCFWLPTLMNSAEDTFIVLECKRFYWVTNASNYQLFSSSVHTYIHKYKNCISDQCCTYFMMAFVILIKAKNIYKYQD